MKGGREREREVGWMQLNGPINNKGEREEIRPPVSFTVSHSLAGRQEVHMAKSAVIARSLTLCSVREGEMADLALP